MPGNKKNIYFEKTNDGKQILRDMMSNYIPEEITKAPKKGFSSPDASWFKGESINFVRDTLVSKNSPIYDYIEFDITKKLVDEHLSGQQNRRLLIWSLLNINKWIEQSL
jgi:asparagine synthase (glutamine-hydrolysing)